MRSLTVSWSDPHVLAQAGRALSGLEFLRAIRDGRLPSPPIAELLGFRLVQAEPGHAVFEVQPGERSAMGCAIQTEVPAGATATLEAKTNLTRAITAATGRLRAIGKVVHLGSRVATAEARLVDGEGKLYAHATTTCIVLREG